MAALFVPDTTSPTQDPLFSAPENDHLSPQAPKLSSLRQRLFVNANTTTNRHEEFTFGVEVEMVVAGLPDELDVYDVLVETMMKLAQTGALDIECEKWFEFTGEIQDRSKFLVQKDASIDDRLFNIPMGCAVSKIEGFGPSSFCSGGGGTPAALAPSFEEELLGDSSMIEQGYRWGYSDLGDTASTRSTRSVNQDDWEHDPDWFAETQRELFESSPPTSVSGDTFSEGICDAEPLSWPNSPIEGSMKLETNDTKLVAVTEKALRITENGFVGPVIPIGDVAWVHGKAVEICTPIMTAQDYKHILFTTLNYLNSQLDVRFNRSTGLHVHVGCGKGMKWSHADINAIAKAVVMFERLIDRMHPESRLDQNSWMIGSNRSSALLAALSITEVFEYFDSCKNSRQLGNLVGRDRFVKYNFTANDKYGTVEFRQALGTGDPKEVLAWVDFVARFVKGALEVTKEEWEEWGKIVGMGTAEEALKLDPTILDKFGIPNHIRF